MIAFISGTAAVIAGVVAAVLVVVVVIAVVMGGKKSGPSEGESATKPPEAEKKPEPAVEAKPEPVAEKQPEPKPEPVEAKQPEPAKPPTLEVEALSPSATGEAPMLGAEADEMRMGTDELPKMGTTEMPALADTGPTQYRTQAAKDLSKAIETGDCPKCKAPTFVGSEDPEEVGADGVAMFKLTGRCGACGHRAELIDMKA